jgi:peptidoglycan/LPS O-acetylase OafA/YrhL
LLTFTFNLKLIFTEHGSAANWPPFGAMWSLAVEEQFYLFFPWLFVGLPRRRLVLALLGIIAAAPLIRWGWGQFAASFGWPTPRVALAVYAFGPAHFDAFAAGALIALYRQRIEQAAIEVRRLAVGVILAGGLYSGSYVILQAVRSGRLGSAFHNVVSGVLLGDLREVFVYPVMWSFAAVLLMLILSGERSALALCRLPGLQAVGRVSFGIYMVNLPLFLLARACLPALPDRLYHPLALCCVVPASFALAWLSWRFYERRFLPARSRVG